MMYRVFSTYSRLKIKQSKLTMWVHIMVTTRFGEGTDHIEFHIHNFFLHFYHYLLEFMIFLLHENNFFFFGSVVIISLNDYRCIFDWNWIETNQPPTLHQITTCIVESGHYLQWSRLQRMLFPLWKFQKTLHCEYCDLAFIH